MCLYPANQSSREVVNFKRRPAHAGELVPMTTPGCIDDLEALLLQSFHGGYEIRVAEHQDGNGRRDVARLSHLFKPPQMLLTAYQKQTPIPTGEAGSIC